MLKDKLDAAIARAEKAELEAKAPRGNGWADAQEVRNFKEQIAAAQAAHADAVALLRKWRHSAPPIAETDEHLAKHGGGK